MIDRNNIRDDIEEQLQGKSSQQCVAFAVRAAMRLLPLLAVRKEHNAIAFGNSKEEAFWYWQPKRSQHLLAVCQAYGWGVQYVLDKSAVYAKGDAYAAYAAYDTASDTAAVARAAAVRAAAYPDADARAADSARAAACAAYAAYAAQTGRAYAETSAVRFAAAVADAAADAAVRSDVDGIIHELEADLAALSHVSAAVLLIQPLWSRDEPNDWQQRIQDFKNDALSLNAGFEVWLDWYDDRLHGKPIDIALLKNWNSVSEEIGSQGAEKVNAYLKNLQDKTATCPLNRVRAIFIGYGEAGKTSLIRALHDEPVEEGKEPMTPGIDIRTWPVPDSGIQALFWDFGGQVMAHATHQFFLRSSCLYVLLLNARSEIDSTVQAEYWLEHVQSFGKDAPVMIVGNKADQSGINLDMGYLKGKYSNIVDFYPLSCTQAKTSHKAEFERFQRDFCRQLQQVGTHQMLFSQDQFAVLEDLRGRSPKAAFLKHSEFNDICSRHGIGTEGVLNRDWLLEILDKLGVVVHFPQLTFLDEYVLNPRWLTYGVYTLMYSKQAKLTEAEIIRLLSQKQVSDEAGNVLDYPKDKCRFIMDAMRQFKLCYPLPSENHTLIIPELLPTDQPASIPFAKPGALAFEFVFRGFLPRNILPELIVNRHEEIVDQVVWQRGVLLQHKKHQANALVQVDYHDRVLSIWVQGRDAKDYLGLLNDEVLKILKRLELEPEEKIALPLSACISDKRLIEKEEKASYRQILACAGNGGRTYISERGDKYDLNQVLGLILSKDEQERLTQIFYGDIGELKMSEQSIKIGDNNTIGGSVVAAEKIENSFNRLQESKANDEVKTLLEQLLSEIQALNAKVPSTQAQQLTDMAGDVETLMTETGRETPRPKQYQLSLEGIKEAAVTLGDIAKPVLAVAEKLAPLLGLL